MLIKAKKLSQPQLITTRSLFKKGPNFSILYEWHEFVINYKQLLIIVSSNFNSPNLKRHSRVASISSVAKGLGNRYAKDGQNNGVSFSPSLVTKVNARFRSKKSSSSFP